MKKSVLVDCERMKYPNSGISNVSKALVKGLEELKPEFQISYYGPEKMLEEFTAAGKIVKLKPFDKFIAPKKAKFQLIHVSHQLSKYFHRLKQGQKKVVTLHDLNFLHDASKSKKRDKYLRLVQKNIGNADVIVCISEFVKEDFLRFKYFFRLKPDVKVEVVHNGLVFPEELDFSSEKYTYLKTRSYLLNIGVLFPKKNQLVLPDFVAKTNLDLVLVTSDAKSDYHQLFMEKVKALHLEDRIHILQNVSENDKFFLLQNCTAYVHPSLAEGFGIPPIEALFFKKPVFLSKMTSLPEIGGDAAFYFESFSAEDMAAVFKERMEKFNENREASENRARKHALHFSYLKMAEKYLEVYRNLLE